MKALLSLVNRNNKVFRRDRVQIVFALLTVGILIALYALFLRQENLSQLENIVGSNIPAMYWLADTHMVAGLLTICTVTTTLTAFGVMVWDKERQKDIDFLATPLSRNKIQWGYLINAMLIGLVFTAIAFFLCELFIKAAGGEFLTFAETMKVFGLLILSLLLASSMNLFISFLVKTQRAFSTINTIVGTLIGFLLGAYFPMGVFPQPVQFLIKIFPLSHIATLLRQVMMERPMQLVFSNTTASIDTYKLHYGVVYSLNGNIVSPISSIIFILISTVVFASLSIYIFKKINK
ncbi:ABC-2 family transporter [Ruminiclostridium sufflavum DSM 19573]|uniref:Transport permease protein n=1 Tax=Ruminiclostridium sufflavum DSM 19573 TaxID=1121337 RepID=A0A318Y2I7_9FIRM|nr:ABC transporter permease [Ruminiclostridium sufflavum]PYG85716.1 ABC-2 family transporter [Ruminiclostridium sufflavum DSM 19573]